MIDFTSSLYLGMRHASGSLRPWGHLTTGAPAALAAPPGAREIAGRLAALIGCDRATLAPSTLHLFWDLFGMFGRRQVAIYMDAGVYPIARWGIERAAARGVPVHTFAHYDVEALHEMLRRNRSGRRRPVVVSDGFCPGCGTAAPIAEYLESVRAYGGQLVIDDTQALGIFGHPAGAHAPYGLGGGGSLRRWDVSGREVLVIASMAKGFGVPMAVMAGSRPAIEDFEERSETRVHCSPPSIATLHAAEHALDRNEEAGDTLRTRLAQEVTRFRHGLAQAGLTAGGGLFPVQTLILPPAVDSAEFHGRLLESGIRTVLHAGRNGVVPRISFIITARHRADELDRAIDILQGSIVQLPRYLGREETHGNRS